MGSLYIQNLELNLEINLMHTILMKAVSLWKIIMFRKMRMQV